MKQEKQTAAAAAIEWEHCIKQGDCMQKMLMEVQPPWCYCDQLHVTSQNKGENDRQCHSWVAFSLSLKQEPTMDKSSKLNHIHSVTPSHCSPLHSPGKQRNKNGGSSLLFPPEPHPYQWGCKWYKILPKHIHTFPGSALPPQQLQENWLYPSQKWDRNTEQTSITSVLIVLLKHSMFLANISFEEGPKIRLSFPSTLKCLPTNQILEENEDQVQNKYQDNQKTTSTKF